MTQVLGGQALLLARMLVSLWHERPTRRSVLEQVVELGLGSLGLVVSGMAFFGTVIVTIAWAQARKYTATSRWWVRRTSSSSSASSLPCSRGSWPPRARPRPRAPSSERCRSTSRWRRWRCLGSSPRRAGGASLPRVALRGPGADDHRRLGLRRLGGRHRRLGLRSRWHLVREHPLPRGRRRRVRLPQGRLDGRLHSPGAAYRGLNAEAAPPRWARR